MDRFVILQITKGTHFMVQLRKMLTALMAAMLMLVGGTAAHAASTVGYDFDAVTVTKSNPARTAAAFISQPPSLITLQAQKNTNISATWTAVTAGTYKFDWSFDAAASTAKAYFVQNGVLTLLSTGSGTGLGTLFNIAAGDTFGFKVFGITGGTKPYFSTLQVVNFGAPEINGGILPLAMLLMVFGFVAMRRKLSNNLA